MNTPPLTCEELVQMSDRHRQLLSSFAAVLKNNHGATTPVEELIRDLVFQYGMGSWDSFTPESLTETIEEYRDGFNDVIAFGRLALERFPDLVQAPATEVNS